MTNFGHALLLLYVFVTGATSRNICTRGTANSLVERRESSPKIRLGSMSPSDNEAGDDGKFQHRNWDIRV